MCIWSEKQSEGFNTEKNVKANKRALINLLWSKGKCLKTQNLHMKTHHNGEHMKFLLIFK